MPTFMSQQHELAFKTGQREPKCLGSSPGFALCCSRCTALLPLSVPPHLSRGKGGAIPRSASGEGLWDHNFSKITSGEVQSILDGQMPSHLLAFDSFFPVLQKHNTILCRSARSHSSTAGGPIWIHRPLKAPLSPFWESVGCINACLVAKHLMSS